MIHQYKLGGYNIVLDVCSGSVHAVDEVAYEMIAKYLDKDKDTLISEMKELYKDRLDISEMICMNAINKSRNLKMPEKFFLKIILKRWLEL